MLFSTVEIPLVPVLQIPLDLRLDLLKFDMGLDLTWRKNDDLLTTLNP